MNLACPFEKVDFVKVVVLFGYFNKDKACNGAGRKDTGGGVRLERSTHLRKLNVGEPEISADSFL
jgi:hypothetical protein